MPQQDGYFRRSEAGLYQHVHAHLFLLEAIAKAVKLREKVRVAEADPAFHTPPAKLKSVS